MSPYLLAYPVRELALATPLVIAVSGFAQAACYNSRQQLPATYARAIHGRPGAAAIQISEWRRADDINGPGFGRFRSRHASACP